MKSFGKFSLVVALPLVSLLLIVFCGTPAFAQQKYVLKFNHVLGQKEPYHQGFLNWAKAVETRTKGGLKIEVFHSAQLGVEETEHFRLAIACWSDFRATRSDRTFPAAGCNTSQHFPPNGGSGEFHNYL